LKLPSKKLVNALILVAVFLVSYAAAFFAISLTPYGHYSARVYSKPQVAYWGDVSLNSSSAGGAWQDQLLSLGPSPGSNNVPRDTLLIILGARPVGPMNLTFSPELPIAKETDIYHTIGGPFSTLYVYPTGLLQPNTTYNVSAIVAGTPSWWTFTTSSVPSKLTFVYPLASYDTWVALIVAILVTSIVSTVLYVAKRAYSQSLNALVPK
jgi:hypothetical protein